MDGDDIFDEALELQWKSMILRGYTEEQVNHARQRKKDKDDVRMLSYIVRQHAWETDISCSRVDVHLRLARALDAVCRRSDAIEILLEATEEDHPFDSRMCIALAKILFRDDQKDLSLVYCLKIIDAYNLKAEDSGNQFGTHISKDDTIKAYYLAGWIQIHDDNHTKAYEIWSLGHQTIRSCPVLKKQYKKRECWDQDPNRILDWKQQVVELLTIPEAPILSSENLNLDSERLLEPFAVSPNASIPPLSLFCPEKQRKCLVFRTKEALLSPGECSSVLRIVDQHHTQHLGGKWGTVRHSSVKTTDVAVEDISALKPWLLALLHSKIFPLLSVAFPVLADGSSLLDPATVPATSRLRVHDAFIVRYDAENDQSLSLPEHCDTSSMSVILSLNEEENEREKEASGSSKEGTYSGGGTWFEALGPNGLVVNAGIGQAVMFAGPLKHAGFPITSGIRNILVLFLYVEGFHYGPLLREYNSKHSAELETGPEPEPERTDDSHRTYIDNDSTDNPRSSGAAKGGFVVYRQTVELVSMLEEAEEGPE